MDSAYELWLVNAESGEAPLQVRSWRGWDMTDLLPELASFPVFGGVATSPLGKAGAQVQ